MRTTSTRPILICFDRSVGSIRAIETAADLLPGRPAIVLHIYSPTAAVGAVYGAMVPSAELEEAEILRAAVRLAEEGAQLARDAGLEASAAGASARFDGTANAILKVAAQHDVEAIVIGARGLSAVRSLLLGSVSHGVVQHAHCPVLVVPPQQQAEAVVAPIEAERAPAVLLPAGIALASSSPSGI